MSRQKNPVERLTHAAQLLELLEHYVSLHRRVENQPSDEIPWAGFCSTLGLSKELLLDTIEELRGSTTAKGFRTEERRIPEERRAPEERRTPDERRLDEPVAPQYDTAIPSRSRSRSVSFNPSHVPPTNTHHSAVGGTIREISDERPSESLGSTFNRIQLHDAPTNPSSDRQ